ncbi:MAG: SDR family NAD(P)-dependent oxidoreductase [Chloroflexota bacterium]
MTVLKDAVVLITGANGGFGQQMTRQLLAKESKLILTDINIDALKETAATISDEVRTGEILGVFGADLSTPSGCEQIYQQAQEISEQTELSVDVLINNAGIAVAGRADEVPTEKGLQILNINLIAPIRLCELFMAGMIERESGHIVNISSLAGWVGPPGLGHYAATKFGLRGFGLSLYEELKPFNVHVTTIYPFYSDTPILDSPRYGQLAEETELRDNAITDPADVVAEMIAGIEANQQHVFPDRTGKIINNINRFVPWMLPALLRRIS